MGSLVKMVLGVEQPGQILLSIQSLVIIGVFFTAMKVQRLLRIVERLFNGCFNIEVSETDCLLIALTEVTRG